MAAMDQNITYSINTISKSMSITIIEKKLFS